MKVPGIRYVQGLNDYTDHDGLKFGIAIHNTSNDASDEGEASYATRRPDGVSAHFYCDADSVTQSIDTEDRTGHAGSNTGNNNAISVEITGANGKTRAWWLANVAWDELGRVLAYVIKHDPDYRGFQVRRASVAEMRANPRVKAFYGHDDMRQAWGGTDHTDPGPSFPWDRLFQAVNAHLEDDMAFGDTQAKQLESVARAMEHVDGRLDAFTKGLATVSFGPAKGQRMWPVATLTAALAAMQTLAGAVAGVDEATKAQLQGDLAALRTLVQEQGAADAVRDSELQQRLTTELVPALVAALQAEVDGLPADVVEGATERAVRRVLGSLDGAAQG